MGAPVGMGELIRVSREGWSAPGGMGELIKVNGRDEVFLGEFIRVSEEGWRAPGGTYKGEWLRKGCSWVNG